MVEKETSIASHRTLAVDGSGRGLGSFVAVAFELWEGVMGQGGAGGGKEGFQGGGQRRHDEIPQRLSAVDGRLRLGQVQVSYI